MSELLKLLNRLKVEARLDILTDAQKLAYDKIVQWWQFPVRVNLYGEPGVGKTMVGWAMGNTLEAAFFANLKSFQESDTYPLRKAIVDNNHCESKAIRAVLAEAQLRNNRRTLIITTEPNRLGLSTVALKSPEKRDVDVIYHNLSLLEYYPIDPTYSDSLWDLIYSVL
jgi:hypothetical protein